MRTTSLEITHTPSLIFLTQLNCCPPKYLSGGRDILIERRTLKFTSTGKDLDVPSVAFRSEERLGELRGDVSVKLLLLNSSQA
ncbi:hypothetical protein NPIL_498901 [Nephila pilipes]|uniref:Uncharacterized protein n=1 Tax=Nephila pilipes TaxID=299642 RepID=A0A8X6PCG7_NEPPI|nr:hypothetical protein NPIL_498901 [Nephila pilipes]